MAAVGGVGAAGKGGGGGEADSGAAGPGSVLLSHHPAQKDSRTDPTDCGKSTRGRSKKRGEEGEDGGVKEGECGENGFVTPLRNNSCCSNESKSRVAFAPPWPMCFVKVCGNKCFFGDELEHNLCSTRQALPCIFNKQW